VPERDAELLKVDVGQLGQDIAVDFTRAKERLVLAQTELSQPTPDIHRRTPRAANRSSFGYSVLSSARRLKSWVGDGSFAPFRSSPGVPAVRLVRA
jgi:hypothetical protein